MSRKEFTMRRTSNLVLVAAMVLAGLIGLRHIPIAAAQDEPSTTDHPLVGSWVVLVTLEDQGADAVLPPELASLVTYFADGNVLAANAGQLPPLPPGSGLFFTEGHGQWTPIGDSTAEATFVSLVLDQTGGLSSTNTARSTLEVDASGNSYTGSLTLESLSSTGTSTGSQEVSIDATRIQVDQPATPES